MTDKNYSMPKCMAVGLDSLFLTLSSFVLRQSEAIKEYPCRSGTYVASAAREFQRHASVTFEAIV